MLRFSYQVREHGWATASITDDISRLELGPTLIFNDPLADLARTCVALLDTVNSPYLSRLECSWLDEPGEWRWLLEKQGTTLHIRNLQFDDLPSRLPNEKGAVVFTTECSLLKFAIQVKTQLRDISNELGTEEYRQRTGHPFPAAQFDQLTRLIRAAQVAKKAQEL